MNTSYIIPKILIVDDEPHARKRLRNLLSDIKSVFEHEIVAEADSYHNALDKIKIYQPDIIFIDINMPDKSGIELAKEINLNTAEIIFLTARDDCALDAYNLNAIDYLLKPVKADRLGNACIKAKISIVHKREIPEITILEKGKVIKIPLTEICYLMADTKYTTIKTQSGEYLTTITLTSLEEKYSEWFIRIHRSILVSKNNLKQLEKSSNHADEESKWFIPILNEHLPVSRRQLAAVKKFLKL